MAYYVVQVSIVRIFAIRAIFDRFVIALEPTLGVINACSPVIQPVVCKIFDGTILAWSKLTSTGGTSGGGFRSKGHPSSLQLSSSSGGFRRLPADLYPLTDVTATRSYASGPARQSASDTNMKALNGESDHHTGIEVKWYIGVESTAITQS